MTSAAKSLSIVIAPLASIALAPASPSIQQNGQQQFTATASYTGETQTADVSAQSGGNAPALAASACGSASNNTSSFSSLTTTSPCSVNVGDTLVVHYHVDNGASNPTFTAPTDAGGNTAAVAVAKVCRGAGSDRCDADYYIPVTTANAADVVTCGFGTSTHPVSCTVVKIIGTASSPLDQNGSSYEGGVAGVQGTSASITPTVANTIAIVVLSPNNGGRAFTPSTQCSLIITDAIGFTGIEACTGLTTSATIEQMSFNGAAQSWDMSISNYKAAASSGSILWTATDSSGLNVAAVNSTGLALGQNAGTSNIKACIGAICSPNDLLTVNGSVTDTGLVIAPSPASGTVGGSTSFSAHGNNTGTDFTRSVTWSSSNSSVATIGPTSNIASDLVNGTTTITASTAGSLSISGSATLAVSTPGTGGLLTGAVVAGTNADCTTNTISVPVPSGWSLVCAQGFEAGGIGSKETFNISAGGSITATNAHSGSHALVGQYNDPDQTVSWVFCGNAYISANCPQVTGIGAFSDVYISYWEYVDPNALFGDSDYFYGGIVQPNVCGQVQDVQYDMQNFAVGQASSLKSNMIVVSEGYDTQATPCMGKYQYQHQQSPQLAMNQGFWRQMEIRIHPSTTVTNSTTCLSTNDGSDCTGDGTTDLYVNGQNLVHITNADLNGTTSMTNAIVTVGGVLTDLSGCGDWSAPTCTGSRPGALPPAPFHRYIDDIIILKK